MLIIDDDETFRYVLKQIIRNEPRYEVMEASDGGEGLRQARGENPDVIVLDLQMPNIDGFTVLAGTQRRRTHQRHSAHHLHVPYRGCRAKGRLPIGHARHFKESDFARERLVIPARRDQLSKLLS